MLGIVAILIMLVTDCTCQDDRCDGSWTREFKSAEPAVMVLMTNTDNYTDVFGANEVWQHHEFSPEAGTVETFTLTDPGVELPSIYLLNGWSDLGRERAMTRTFSESESIECPNSPALGLYYYSFYVDSLISTKCQTPPTRLHLVLDSLRDFIPGTYLTLGGTSPKDYLKGKEWGIDSLIDNQGQDVSSSANWACFADNHYVFLNNGQVEYNQGTLLCGDEPDNEGKPYYFAFTVAAENPTDHDNPGEITLTVHVGGWVDDLEDVVFKIERSDFNRISGTVVKDGETANFVIKPR